VSDTDSLGRPEVDIFKRFVTVCPLKILPESIEKRQPPEPDIRCTSRAGDVLAFELVEIIDQDLARKVSDQLRLVQELGAAYEVLPERDAAEVRAALGNAAVMLTFADDSSIRTRRAAIRSSLEALKGVPPKFEGAMDLKRGILERIYVARGDFIGPSFDVDAGGAVGDPTVARIQGKFEKPYKVDVPLELLAHFELHPMFPDDVWMPKVRDLVPRALTASPFRRVWIFDGERESIRFVYPA
jgi:hypothetical protein